MWNPPWILALALPLAPLPLAPATVIWVLVQLGLIIGCGLVLWRYFAPGDNRLWVGAVLSVAFAPTVFALRMGQSSPWLLAGIVGFLYAQRARKDLLAGVSLALLMIKPHLAYLFWLAAMWWAWRHGRRRVLIGWLSAIVIAALVVLLFSSDVFGHYLAVVGRTDLPLDWATPTLSGWLRFLIGLERRWVQFLPSLLGVVGLAVWLWRRQGPWHWQDLASPLLLASVLTTPFGWSFDQILLFPVVVDLVARVRRAPRGLQFAVLGALVAFQAGLWLQNQLGANEVFYVWHVPALAGLYWWSVRQAPAGGQDERASGAPSRGSRE
jgi:hypothetical protein